MPAYNSIRSNFINDYIIYGAGEAGKQMYESLKLNNKKIFCFIDDNEEKQSKILFGKKIISSSKFEQILKFQNFSNLIIAIPTLDNKNFLKIKNKYKKKIPNIEFIPLKNKLKSDIISLSDLSNLEINSILKRKSKNINYDLLNENLKNKSILITGGGGSIGSQLCRNLLNIKCKKIVILDNSELNIFHFKKEMTRFKKVKFFLGDILDVEYLDHLMKKEKINIIFHAAAYKHVNILEENIHSAIRNNIFGTKNVLNVAKRNKKISVITISTDKAVKPKNVLGITKRVSELIALAYNDKNFNSKVVRFGNVFGSKGSAVPTFINQINEGMPITITNKKAKRYFMTINEACFLLLLSVKIKNPKNVLVLKMGKQIKILDIINQLIKIKKNLNKNYKFKIKQIGLKNGEKINEELSISKKLNQTSINDLNITNDPKYTKKKILELLNLIENNKNYQERFNTIKFFLKKELC